MVIVVQSLPIGQSNLGRSVAYPCEVADPQPFGTEVIKQVCGRIELPTSRNRSMILHTEVQESVVELGKRVVLV